MHENPDDLTLILVGDERSPVRRVQFRRARITQAIVAAVCFVALFAAVGADWVRLRMAAVDVAALRVETQGHADAVARLEAEVQGLHTGIDEVRELERKVRVIANLPGGVAHAQVPDAATLANKDAKGDDAEAPNEAQPPAKAAPAAAPGKTRAADAPEARRDEEHDTAWLQRQIEIVEAEAEALAAWIPIQGESLSGLIGGLEGKSDQLEATPSIWPTNGWVTSGYGYRTSPFTGRRQFHKGIDIAAPFGTPILSPAKGRVSFVGRKGPMGITVEIDHGYGMRTSYGHMAKADVEKGQRVERGEAIGLVGSTGRSTGPHLHYAVARSGKSVNPRDYVIE